MKTVWQAKDAFTLEVCWGDKEFWFLCPLHGGLVVDCVLSLSGYLDEIPQLRGVEFLGITGEFGETPQYEGEVREWMRDNWEDICNLFI